MTIFSKMSRWIKRVAGIFALIAALCALAFASGESVSEVETFIRDNPGKAVPLSVEGMDAAALSALLAEYPDVEFEYTLSLCGQEVSSTQTELILEGEVTPEMVLELKTWLPCLPALSKVDMYDTELPDEGMEYFFTTYPDIRFGWTLHVGRWYVRTDAEAFSTLKTPESSRFKTGHFEKLRYCYQLKALDLGHNSITDISFLENLTEIRVLILADNKITDITPLKNLRNLQYVELFMNRISDISPICDNPLLLDVNLTYNRIYDWSPLTTCPNIERLWFGENGIKGEERDKVAEAFPNTQIIYSTGSTGYGWRNHPRYDVIYEIFHTGKYIPFEDAAAE